MSHVNWYRCPWYHFLHNVDIETWLCYLFLKRGEGWQGEVDRRRGTSGWISTLESLFTIQYGSYYLVISGNRADIHSKTGDISKCRTIFFLLCNFRYWNVINFKKLKLILTEIILNTISKDRMAQIYSGFYIRSHSRHLPKRCVHVIAFCVFWSHDTTSPFVA